VGGTARRGPHDRVDLRFLVAVLAFLFIVAAAIAPPGFPLPLPAARHQATAASRELGRYLFYDRRLSVNGTQSCATCHQQERAFTDGRARAIGSTGQEHTRNTQTLTNVAYNASFTWTNMRVRSLEEQALVPMFNRHPVELGIRGNEQAVLQRLRGDDRYAQMFRRAFPGRRQPVTIANIARAIASFERTLISGRSPYDRFVYDVEMNALDTAAWRGMGLFFSSRAGCTECHTGFNLSGPVRYVGRTQRPALVSNGVTVGRFRVPTLRNVELTEPYMHDGSISTLSQVIARYNEARRLQLTAGEQSDLIAFLRSLTDRDFTSDPALADPWLAMRALSPGPARPAPAFSAESPPKPASRSDRPGTLP
jgi:cytochrome c peroxidase